MQEDYETGRLLARGASGFGWIMVVFGVIALFVGTLSIRDIS